MASVPVSADSLTASLLLTVQYEICDWRRSKMAGSSSCSPRDGWGCSRSAHGRHG